MQPFDLHTHSLYSDGTASPAEIVREAQRLGLAMVAITDHDTADGVNEALAEGERIGMKVIPGVEFDVDYDVTVHILGLGIDVNAPKLQEAVRESARKRDIRNRVMIEKLRALGMDISMEDVHSVGLKTRLHIAEALVRKGYAATWGEAFDKYMLKGRPAFVRAENLPIRETVEVIHKAGGIAVLAHPCQIRGDKHKAILAAVEGGIDGIEAYYPGTTDGERVLYLSLAAQYGLLVSSGSDHHGANRPAATLGCAFQDVEVLRPIFERFMA